MDADSKPTDGPKNVIGQKRYVGTGMFAASMREELLPMGEALRILEADTREFIESMGLTLAGSVKGSPVWSLGDWDQLREHVRMKVRKADITASNVVVDRGYHWQPMKDCPINSKVQLLGKGGLPQYGYWDGKNPFWVGWAPIPTRDPNGQQGV